MNAENIPPAPLSGPDVGLNDESNMDGLPRRFGKYTLLRKLAVGGMAELFLAIQRSVAGFEKLIVIKRILPAMNQDRAFIEMLLHEARVAATLSHPNIVQVFDVGEVDGTHFIAMEHVHGEDIRSIVRQMRKRGVTEFPIEHAISIVLGVCAGLAYAHEKRDLDGKALNIVHRDISPQNVVVTFSGDVKIVDFGIAKSDVRLHENTRSGRLKGKVPYMSPEQARGEVVDWRSDIFAAGVMLFELTTGKRLFKGSSDYETLKLICDRDYPLPSQIREGYPIDLERIVMRALSKDRETRYQSAREMQQALEDFARRERIPVSTIALNQFMQSLFEDKLASQKEALSQGKLLADIIEAKQGQDSVAPDDGARLSQSILSTPAASRTLTEINALRRRRSVAMGVVATLAIAGAGVATWRTRLMPHPAPTVTAATPPPVDAPAPKDTGTIAPAKHVDTVVNKVAAATPQAAPATPTASLRHSTRGGAATQPTGSGKLNIGASGGWCNVTVDGVARGATPIAGLDVSAGPHKLSCAPPDGKPQTTTVNVTADSTTRYRFALDQ